MASATETTTDTLNSLLRGELSAVETYRQAEQKFHGEYEEANLQRLEYEHQQAVDQLRRHVHMKGGQAAENSGAWGVFAQLVEGSAKIFGKAAALKALKEGEEIGIGDYESALKNESLPSECRSLIRDTLLPRCRQHLKNLDQLMSRND